MGIFRRRREGDTSEPGPDWAQPMSQDEAAAFLEGVARELERRELPHEIGEGTVRVERAGEWSDFGMSNLAQFCHQAGRAGWQEAIATHFDNLFAAADDEARFQELVHDFEGIRSLLKVRLYPSETFEDVDQRGPARWELAPGLTAVFVYDLPTTVRTANADDVTQWRRSHDELFSVALANVRADAVASKPMAEGASAPIACFADHFFAASHALLLGERVPPAANGSALFAVPHRHALLYAPMVDMGIVESINRLIRTTVVLFQEGPGSISPSLYWWREGDVSLLPSQFDGSTLHFAPPDEFVQALEALPSA